MRRKQSFILSVILMTFFNVSMSSIAKEEFRPVSSATVKALLEVAKARNYIIEKKIIEAKTALYEASKYIDLVRAEIPPAAFLDRIAITKQHLAHSSLPTLMDDFSALYGELLLVDKALGSREARKHLDLAKTNVEKGERTLAGLELSKAGKALAPNANLVPLARTVELVNEAMQSLEKGNMKRAEVSLALAERTLPTEVVATVNAVLLEKSKGTAE